ncbi:DUF1311 domain-containing protein [bacterium]|nr:DUF1311 domain-containing protein [bacterium]
MKNLLTITFTVLSVIAYGQTDKTHQIDKELQNCLDSSENYTTSGMSGCVSEATKKWDAELNKKYKQLMNLLPAEQKEKLRTAQREWIKYRDKELEFSNQFYNEMGGSMWTPVAAGKNLDLTKQRTLELEKYISVLSAGD